MISTWQWSYIVGRRCHGNFVFHTRTLFSGRVNAVEPQFIKWLKYICGDHSQDLLILGLLILDNDTHSFRNGVASFLSGIVGEPSIIAIYLRAAWSLGHLLTCARWWSALRKGSNKSPNDEFNILQLNSSFWYNNSSTFSIQWTWGGRTWGGWPTLITGRAGQTKG